MTESVDWGALVKQMGTSMDPLPPSDYPVVVQKCEATKSQNGKHMWKLTLNVEGGPHANRKVWDQLVLTTDNPNALNMFFGKMKTLGLEPNFFASNPTPDAIAQALVGRRVTATVAQKIWQGTPRNEVKGYKAALGGAAMPGSSPAVPGVPGMTGAVSPQPMSTPAPAPAPAQVPIPPAPTPIPPTPEPIPAPAVEAAASAAAAEVAPPAIAGEATPQPPAPEAPAAPVVPPAPEPVQPVAPEPVQPVAPPVPAAAPGAIPPPPEMPF